MVKVNLKYQTKYSAVIEANRLANFIGDKSLLPVYASSNTRQRFIHIKLPPHVLPSVLII
jgi:hypothetical protein